MFSKLTLALVGALSLATATTAQEKVAATGSSDVPAFQYGTPDPNMVGVVGRNKNGPTNPDTPKLNTPINQTSVSRLASINSIDDWCTFGPNVAGQPLGNVEEDTVAYCTKPRNNARVIPDGTVTSVHFVKTPLYVQIMANGDFTKINVLAGDEGGELDPHGATNMGNPVGGNVTSNVSGKDVFYEEWMNYISYNQICFRVCIAVTDIAPTPLECQHTLDVMGCNFVMPGNYADNVFETCDGDSAYPPGLYPVSGGGTSTFQQFFSGAYTVDGSVFTYQNGESTQITPTAAYSTPSTSNCQTTSSISNGIASIVPSSSSSSESAAASGSSGMSTSKGSSKGASATAGSAAASGSSGSSSASGASSVGPAFSLAGALVAVGAIVGGAALL